MWAFDVVIPAIKISGLVASTSIFYLGPREYLDIASWSLLVLEDGSSRVCTWTEFLNPVRTAYSELGTNSSMYHFSSCIKNILPKAHGM
jgi:hypothetical protein